MLKRRMAPLLKRFVEHEKLLHILSGLGLSLRDLKTGVVLPSQLLKDLGHGDEILHGDSWLALLHHDDQARVQKAFQQIREGLADTVDEEFRLRDVQGNWHWVRHHTTVLSRHKDDTPDLCVGMDTDITELREKAEHYESRYLETEVLRVAGAIMAIELDPELAIERMLEQAQRVIPFDSAYVWLRKNNIIEYAGGHNTKGGIPQKMYVNDPDYAVVLGAKLPDFSDLPAPKTLGERVFSTRLAVPLISHNEVIGCMEFLAETPGVLQSRHTWPALAFGDYIAIAIQNALSHKETAIEARTDWLTGLLNRRHFEREAIRQLSAARKTCPSSVILVDIDHFKEINDTWGHEAGDLALRRVAEVMKNSLGDSALVCRLGGDEFAILMVGTDEASVSRIARFILAEMRDIRFPEWRNLQLTVSIGFHTCNNSSELLSDMLRKSDAAMYACKRSGRNRVESSVNA